VFLLEDEIGWSGTLGLASWARWNIDNPHRGNSSCRAWALHSVPIIAHELGHCFGLKHNEDDHGTELDLMQAHYSHVDWVKRDNKDIVADYFSPEVASSRAYKSHPVIEFAN